MPRFRGGGMRLAVSREASPLCRNISGHAPRGIHKMDSISKMKAVSICGGAVCVRVTQGRAGRAAFGRYRAMRRLIACFILLASAAWPVKELYPSAKEGGNYMHNYYLPPAPSSYPWWPAWSPDGKSLAISLLGSIWRVDPGTGHAVELTYNRRYHSSPNWSPDAKWIIYTADEDNRRIQLEILNVATGETHELTDDQQLYLDPIFSPDGKRIAYVSTEPDGHFNLYVRPFRDGAWDGPAVTLTESHRYHNDRLYVGLWDINIEPAWTRDGKELVFLSNRDVPLGSGDLWRMPAMKDGFAHARRILNEQTLYRTRPDISRDGKRLIYSSTSGAADQFDHLYVLPAGGGTPYKMSFGDYDDFHPRWSPDGEQIALISNEGGLPRLVVMEAYGGKKTRVAIVPAKWKRPIAQVRIQVVDESSRPVPARVQASASDGKFYPPLDAYARMGVYGQHFFHTAGESTIWAPPGRLQVTAVRGLEHWPDRTEIDVREGQANKVRLVVKRLLDLGTAGWRSGSTHVHMNYGGNLRNTLDNLIFMSRAEDQNIVNELVANKDNRILDWMYFEPGGGAHSASKPDMIVLVGEEYRPPFYGHTFLLGLRDHLLSPFTTGYEGTAIESLYPSNTDVLRKAKAQGAVTGYVHPWAEDTDPIDFKLGVGKGFPVDLALGTVDAYEWSNASRGQLTVWHHALNNDFHPTPTGGEDSISNLHISKPVGSFRTYAWVGGEFSASGWLTALRTGATFFTSGPLLRFEIDEKRPGEAIHLPASGGNVKIRASVWSVAPLSRVLIYAGGKPFREIPVKAGAWSNGGRGTEACAEFDGEIPVSHSGWYSLYAEGPHSDLLDVRFPQAGTNAIRVYVGEEKIRNRESAEYFVRWIEKLKGMADAWPGWRSEQEREHVFSQFEQAKRIYERLAAEPQ
jgi:TolB protein